ncbi:MULTISPECIES: DMT family transporter [unclassified Saccharibacter]|uniref:DMT family transporter n=1 Tax=unclassified Saccharibacter TaxID=2648722 RepID=UPI001EF04C9C|nr:MULTISPECIES: DMT family transporter [unclassified Saccharibacter]
MMTITSFTGWALSFLLIIGAGVSLALQQVFNTRLRAELASPWWAGVGSYIVGLVLMLAIALAGTLLSPSAQPLSRLIRHSSASSWTGGIFGAIFVATGIVMVPRFGAATVLAFVVVGQMVGSIVLDHIGFMGLPIHRINATRLTGALLLILGVVMVRH